MDIYARLDYQKGLTSQNPSTKSKVLYNTSGTYLVSCVVQNGRWPVSINASTLKTRGVVADAKVYFYDTDDEEQALYICTFLNSPIIDKLVKPMQSR